MPPSITAMAQTPTFEGRPLPDPSEPVFDRSGRSRGASPAA